MGERASLNATLNALVRVRDSNAGSPLAGIMDHSIRTMLDMADAIKSALAGDSLPAAQLAKELRLDEMDIRP